MSGSSNLVSANKPIAVPGGSSAPYAEEHATTHEDASSVTHAATHAAAHAAAQAAAHVAGRVATPLDITPDEVVAF